MSELSVVEPSQNKEVKMNGTEEYKEVRIVSEDKNNLDNYFPNEMSKFIFYRTYSRWRYDLSRRETWVETVDRVINFFKDVGGKKISNEDYELLRDNILTMKVMPSMRLMWTAGEAAKKNNFGIYNCSYLSIDNIHSWAEIMFILMHGTGVGYSVEMKCIEKLPTIKEYNGETKKIKVLDSKDGWATSLARACESWWDGYKVEFDYSKIRPSGSILKTFGGRASGPQPLKNCYEYFSTMIERHRGRKLSTVNCHDLSCKVAEAIVVGGVRRSAMISLSDLHDEGMRNAKQGQFWMIQPQRAMSNNSAVYKHKPSSTEFMKEWLSLAESGTGERGLFNRGDLEHLMPKRRRVTEGMGVNPCVTSDTWIQTSEGARQVKELIDVPFKAVVDGKEHSCRTGFFPTGMKKVFKLKTDRGYELRVTDNHKILVERSRTKMHSGNKIIKDELGYQKEEIKTEWIEAKDLKSGDKIVLNDLSNVSIDIEQKDFNKGWLIGEMVGDGGYNPEKYHGYVRFWGETSEELSNLALTTVKEMGCDFHRPVPMGEKPVRNDCNKTYQVSTKSLDLLAENFITSYEKQILPELEKESNSFIAGFLRGLFDSDGTVLNNIIKGRSIRLAQNNLKRLKIVQRMLHRLGIPSTIYENRSGENLTSLLPDGHGGKKEYKVKQMHELVIKRSSMMRFAEVVGFYDPQKSQKLTKMLIRNSGKLEYRDFMVTKFVSLEEETVEDVYDCTVDEVHRFDANGMIVHNCSEIILRDHGLCNLSEVIIRAGDTMDDLFAKVKTATILGTLQSALTDFGNHFYLSDKWKKNAEQERLLGVSMTGQMDNPEILTPENLESLRDYAIGVNVEYARKLGIKRSAAITCSKPSGTVSQLVDSASGFHPRYSKFYIRRIRISATDPLFKMMWDQGFKFVPEVGQSEKDASTWVIEFPIKSPDGCITRNDLTALEQLEQWLKIKKNWAEHTVSATIYVDDGEWLKVGNWVYDHFSDISGISFLPKNNHIYQLAPYEEITEKVYLSMLPEQKSVDYSKLSAYEQEDWTEGAQTLACVGDRCELK